MYVGSALPRASTPIEAGDNYKSAHTEEGGRKAMRSWCGSAVDRGDYWLLKLGGCRVACSARMCRKGREMVPKVKEKRVAWMVARMIEDCICIVEHAGLSSQVLSRVGLGRRATTSKARERGCT